MDEVDRLEQVMRRLRAPDGCPWDREQTHESLKKCLIGEAAEYLDAVDHHDDANMREELGDLLMQVVMNSVMAEERGAFTFRDVAHDITEKMIRRHPHVFGDKSAVNSSDVVALWENVKKEEHKNEEKPSLLARVPHNLPALIRAEKLQKKAAKAGFDWSDETGVRAKLKEEYAEVLNALESNDDVAISEELGDLLFTIVNLARFRGKETASDMIQSASDKFVRRFQFVEKSLASEGKEVEGTSPEILDQLWNKAKENGL